LSLQHQRAQLEQKRKWRVIHEAARDFKPREQLGT